MRSTLYPADWKPGFTDEQGHALHDWSHAGYRKGEVPLPTIDGPLTDVTKAPYSADPTGQKDSTEAIQRALDMVGQAGGGVVYLPEGTYLIRLRPGLDYAIRLRHSRVVLRGAGRDRTRLLCNDSDTRQKIVIAMRPDEPGWWFTVKNAVKVTHDLLRPTTAIGVEDVSQFAVGQLIAVRTMLTAGLIEELGMTGKWTPNDPTVRGMTLARRIVAIDGAAGVLTIDTPTRYPMRMRDELQVYALPDTVIQESAFEDFSVGMTPVPGDGWAEEDYHDPKNGAYHVHFSCAVGLAHAENCWVRNLGTFAPDTARPNVHVHSNGLRLAYCRQVTASDCDFRHAQYHGGGGNGYLFMVNGSDNLFRDNLAVDGRHNFDFQGMSCTGNVLHRNTSRDGSLPCDFHMYFSTANLIDQMSFDGDWFECRYRPYAKPEHGPAGGQNVFWNTRGCRYGKREFILDGRQHGSGYIVGTQGPASAVMQGTTDRVEFVGQGEALEPQSLWQDQLRLRVRRS